MKRNIQILIEGYVYAEKCWAENMACTIDQRHKTGHSLAHHDPEFERLLAEEIAIELGYNTTETILFLTGVDLYMTEINRFFFGG